MLGIALFIASIGINELMRSTVKSREQKKAVQRRENRIEAFNKDNGIIENLLAKDITELTEEDISALNAAIIRIKGTAGNLGESSFTEAAIALENRVQSMQGARLQLQQAAKDDDDVTSVEDNADSKPSGEEVIQNKQAGDLSVGIVIRDEEVAERKISADDETMDEDNADRKPSGNEVDDTEDHGEQSEEERGTADLTEQPAVQEQQDSSLKEKDKGSREEEYDFIESEDEESIVHIVKDPETGEFTSSDRVPASHSQPTAMPSSAPSAMPTFMPLEMSNSTQITLQPLGIIDDMRNYDFSEPVISVSSYTK